MHALVLGANGLLGSNLIDAAASRGWTVAGTYHTDAPDFEVAGFDPELFEFDLRDATEFGAILDRATPDVVFNCAAMTDVDGCERDPERAHEINAEAPGELAARTADRDARFVHVSTDYVFDGTARTPYTESDDANPVQKYGESKLAGERAVQRAVQRADEAPLLARLSFVYGIHRVTGALTGFPAWVRDRLTAGEDVPLFADQHVSPTRAGHAAATLLDLAVADEEGLFNVASRACVTPYEFGASVARRLGASADLLAESSLEDVDRPATRPRYTCLSVERIERVLGREQPSLEADVDALFSSLRG